MTVTRVLVTRGDDDDDDAIEAMRCLRRVAVTTWPRG